MTFHWWKYFVFLIVLVKQGHAQGAQLGSGAITGILLAGITLLGISICTIRRCLTRRPRDTPKPDPSEKNEREVEPLTAVNNPKHTSITVRTDDDIRTSVDDNLPTPSPVPRPQLSYLSGLKPGQTRNNRQQRIASTSSTAVSDSPSPISPKKKSNRPPQRFSHVRGVSHSVHPQDEREDSIVLDENGSPRRDARRTRSRRLVHGPPRRRPPSSSRYVMATPTRSEIDQDDDEDDDEKVALTPSRDDDPNSSDYLSDSSLSDLSARKVGSMKSIDLDTLAAASGGGIRDQAYLMGMNVSSFVSNISTEYDDEKVLNNIAHDVIRRLSKTQEGMARGVKSTTDIREAGLLLSPMRDHDGDKRERRNSPAVTPLGLANDEAELGISPDGSESPKQTLEVPRKRKKKKKKKKNIGDRWQENVSGTTPKEKHTRRNSLEALMQNRSVSSNKREFFKRVSDIESGNESPDSTFRFEEQKRMAQRGQVSKFLEGVHQGTSLQSNIGEHHFREQAERQTDQKRMQSTKTVTGYVTNLKTFEYDDDWKVDRFSGGQKEMHSQHFHEMSQVNEDKKRMKQQQTVNSYRGNIEAGAQDDDWKVDPFTQQTKTSANVHREEFSRADEDKKRMKDEKRVSAYVTVLQQQEKSADRSWKLDPFTQQEKTTSQHVFEEIEERTQDKDILAASKKVSAVRTALEPDAVDETKTDDNLDKSPRSASPSSSPKSKRQRKRSSGLESPEGGHSSNRKRRKRERETKTRQSQILQVQTGESETAGKKAKDRRQSQAVSESATAEGDPVLSRSERKRARIENNIRRAYSDGGLTSKGPKITPTKTNDGDACAVRRTRAFSDSLTITLDEQRAGDTKMNGDVTERGDSEEAWPPPLFFSESKSPITPHSKSFAKRRNGVSQFRREQENTQISAGGD